MAVEQMGQLDYLWEYQKLDLRMDELENKKRIVLLEKSSINLSNI